MSGKNPLHAMKSMFSDKVYRGVYLPFIWHGFFLALTMAMIELNTVLPNLISSLTPNKVAFGALYSIMLGAPLIFNLFFSHYLKKFQYKKKFLLFGIYLRSFSFLGMSVVTLLFAKDHPLLTLAGFYVLILLFALSGGFAGIAYSDMIGKLLPSDKRPGLFATRQIFNGIAGLLGGLLIARIFSGGALDYPYNYVVSLGIGSLGLIVGAFGFWAIKETPSVPAPAVEGKEGILSGSVQILKEDRKFRRFILVENITSFSLMILPFYMVFVKQSFENYKDYFGMYVIAQLMGNILSNFFWAFVSKRLGSGTVLKICILTGALIPVVAIALQGLGAAWYILVFLLIGVIASGRNIGFEPYLLDLAPGDKRTVYLGIRGSLNILVVLLPIAGGLFIEKLGFTAAFAAVSVVMLLAFFIFLAGTRKEEKTAKAN